MCEMLIAAGADINQTLKDGWTFADLALVNKQHSIVDFLLLHGARFSELAGRNLEDGNNCENTSLQSPQEVARDLSPDNFGVPPPHTRSVFLDIISSRRFLDTLRRDGNCAKSKARSMVTAFFEQLSATADKPDPTRCPSGICTRCAQLLTESTCREKPVHWPTLQHLENLALSGCPVCELLLDYLINGVGSTIAPGANAVQAWVDDNGTIKLSLGDVRRQVKSVFLTGTRTIGLTSFWLKNV